MVTGGSSGIGRAFVRNVVSRGAAVSVLALDDGRLADTAAELEAAGVSHVALATDVADAGSVAVAVSRATEALGPCDALLTCAGIAHPGYFQQLDDAVFRSTMEIDYFGTLYALRAVVPAMVERGQGSVVGISSTAGLIGVFGYTAYSPPKFAVRGLLEVLRVELRPHGIHVGCVCPPDTDTPQLAYENQYKPAETFAISGAIKPFTPERVASSIVLGMERGRFLITPDWQGQVVARTTGLAREAWFAYFDARVRASRRAAGGARASRSAHTTRAPK